MINYAFWLLVAVGYIGYHVLTAGANALKCERYLKQEQVMEQNKHRSHKPEEFDFKDCRIPAYGVPTRSKTNEED